MIQKHAQARCIHINVESPRQSETLISEPQISKIDSDKESAARASWRHDKIPGRPVEVGPQLEGKVDAQDETPEALHSDTDIHWSLEFWCVTKCNKSRAAAAIIASRVIWQPQMIMNLNVEF